MEGAGFREFVDRLARLVACDTARPGLFGAGDIQGPDAVGSLFHHPCQLRVAAAEVQFQTGKIQALGGVSGCGIDHSGRLSIRACHCCLGQGPLDGDGLAVIFCRVAQHLLDGKHRRRGRLRICVLRTIALGTAVLCVVSRRLCAGGCIRGRLLNTLCSGIHIGGALIGCGCLLSAIGLFGIFPGHDFNGQGVAGDFVFGCLDGIVAGFGGLEFDGCAIHGERSTADFKVLLLQLGAGRSRLDCNGDFFIHLCGVEFR